MVLLLQGWLLRNVLALLDGLPPRLPLPGFSSAPARPAAMPSASSACDARSRFNMTSSRLPAVVLAIAASLLAACAIARSDGAPCPPVVDYTAGFPCRCGGELDVLPAGSAIEHMLADYQAMRDQARACERFGE